LECFFKAILRLYLHFKSLLALIATSLITGEAHKVNLSFGWFQCHRAVVIDVPLLATPRTDYSGPDALTAN
jgi:hypothetical protein